MPAIINFIKRIYELVYKPVETAANMKLWYIPVDTSTFTEIKKMLVGDLTQIAVDEVFNTIALGGTAILKGNLPSTFSSLTLNPSDFWVYSVVQNNTYDSNLDVTLDRGVVYWYNGLWVYLYKEMQIINKGKITDLPDYSFLTNTFDFGDITGLKVGWAYIVDINGVKDVATDQTFSKGLIYWNSVNWTVLMVSEKKSQEFTVGVGQTTFTVTDFILGKYQLINFDDTLQGSNTSATGQVVTFNDAVFNTKITILNLE